MTKEMAKRYLERVVELGFAARSSVAYNRGFIRECFCDASDSNSCDDKVALFILYTVPQELLDLRCQEKIKMTSASTSFGLCGREWLALKDGTHVLPGDVVAGTVPKLPDTVRTNDILTIPDAVCEEEAEISMETAKKVYSHR